nr:helix-turn-helix transcriptional regulator [uncultured Treponema sp.]
MGFWKNVEKELDFKGISRKELAFKADIAYTGIGLGIERDSMPGADTALKVARVLDVSIEYLLGENTKSQKAKSKKSNQDNILSETELFRKYKRAILSLEKIPDNTKSAVLEMIYRLANNAVSD